jgi:hypothetical protein
MGGAYRCRFDYCDGQVFEPSHRGSLKGIFMVAVFTSVNVYPRRVAMSMRDRNTLTGLLGRTGLAMAGKRPRSLLQC